MTLSHLALLFSLGLFSFQPTKVFEASPQHISQDWTGFRASNFRFYQNKEESPSNMMKTTELEFLKIQFQVEGNNIGKGVRDLFLVFQNNLTKEVFTSQLTKGGAFTLKDGTSLRASAKAIFRYEGNPIDVAFHLIPEGQFKVGAYNAMIYCEGKLIGVKNIFFY